MTQTVLGLMKCNLPMFYKIPIHLYTNVDLMKPQQFMVVEIVDSDIYGWCEFTFYAYRNGNKYFMIPDNNEIAYFTHWRTVSQRKIDNYIKWLFRNKK